jgi:hypothetical protein
MTLAFLLVPAMSVCPSPTLFLVALRVDDAGPPVVVSTFLPRALACGGPEDRCDEGPAIASAMEWSRVDAGGHEDVGWWIGSAVPREGMHLGEITAGVVKAVLSSDVCAV